MGRGFACGRGWLHAAAVGCMRLRFAAWGLGRVYECMHAASTPRVALCACCGSSKSAYLSSKRLIRYHKEDVRICLDKAVRLPVGFGVALIVRSLLGNWGTNASIPTHQQLRNTPPQHPPPFAPTPTNSRAGCDCGSLVWRDDHML